MKKYTYQIKTSIIEIEGSSKINARGKLYDLLKEDFYYEAILIKINNQLIVNEKIED